MSDVSNATETAPFEIVLDFTDDELLQYEAVSAHRSAARTKPPGSIWEGWTGPILIGCVSASAAATLAIASGAVSSRAGAGVAALSFGTFWAGLWVPGFIGRRTAEQQRKVAFDEFRTEWNGARILVTSQGLWMRHGGLRSFVSRNAVQATSREAELFLLHLPRGRPMVIPLRLLTSAQQARLAALSSVETEKGRS
ncbi:hypothetical protein [Bosea sp. BK604]|uniref:hypothetical protein n=1 Tax=Bosea sp. BK604 TaxID=2512180 RepID=UPI00104692BD|nr:hypothetical protein [Bosea sp. BK604]TCR66996.1 hypothetical protein EV560_10352 [Bosea sp. BK604]